MLMYFNLNQNEEKLYDRPDSDRAKKRKTANGRGYDQMEGKLLH